MFKLQLTDGTIIAPLRRLGQAKFELDSNDGSIWQKLNDFNLTLALLFEDDELVDVYIDYMKQNYFNNNGIISFKIRSIAEVKEEDRRKEERERKKREKYNEKIRQRRQRR